MTENQVVEEWKAMQLKFVRRDANNEDVLNTQVKLNAIIKENNYPLVLGAVAAPSFEGDYSEGETDSSSYYYDDESSDDSW